MATGADKRSVFAVYVEKAPAQLAAPPTPRATPPEALRLLDWLQNNWRQPTIFARNIYQLGPYCIRSQERALKAASILEKRGWLILFPSRRRATTNLKDGRSQLALHKRTQKQLCRQILTA